MKNKKTFKEKKENTNENVSCNNEEMQEKNVDNGNDTDNGTQTVDSVEESVDKNENDSENDGYLDERMKFECEKELMKQDMPLSFAQILSGENTEECIENVKLFKKEFMKAVETAVGERLKGTAPKTGKAQNTESDDPFLQGFGR